MSGPHTRVPTPHLARIAYNDSLTLTFWITLKPWNTSHYRCHIEGMFVPPPKFVCQILTPNVMVFGSGAGGGDQARRVGPQEEGSVPLHSAPESRLTSLPT